MLQNRRKSSLPHSPLTYLTSCLPFLEETSEIQLMAPHRYQLQDVGQSQVGETNPPLGGRVAAEASGRAGISLLP